ncbi:hypothetical protein KIW84_057365 [Lathyrus oleraceus]|uniref:Uncharacterized protein n=1 Tax=Pisum sativum TaxID=3888 RepID=A0A9D5ANR2_PEA|nr:hypothetical protein KIW84_057365 [Pisum sativum]
MMQGVAQGQEELRALVQRQEATIPLVNHALPEGVPVNDQVVVVVPVNNYAVGDELRGIRINGQPIAPETANARATRAPVRHPAPLVDRQEDMFTLLSEDDEVVGRTDERDRRVDALAEKIRAMECQNSLGFDVTNMGLVEGLRIPYKFKAPSFDKYNGTSCLELPWIEPVSKIWREFQRVRPEMAGISCKGATSDVGEGVDRYVYWNSTRGVYGPDGELPVR